MSVSVHKIVGVAAVILGVSAFATGLVTVLLATGVLHLPNRWFAGQGTPLRTATQVAAAVEQVILQWRLMLLAICVFQLMHASAVAVSGLRTLRLDPVGAGMLRFAARLGLLFELLKLGPLMMVLYAAWQAIRDFAPGRFPRIPGVELAPELSEAKLASLATRMLILVACWLLAMFAKVACYWYVNRYFNRPETARMFGATVPD